MPVDISVEKLGADHAIDHFECGHSALDNWLRHRALPNQESRDSATFVALDANCRVVAYYALSTASAARIGLPPRLRRNAPDPVPLLLLGRLAVDRDHQGRGIGAAMLANACLRAVRVLDDVGFRALATNPIDAPAQAFYSRQGWSIVPDTTPSLMILPVARLLEALR